MAFAGEFGAHRLAHVVDRAAADDRIRAGEIDVFEDAGPRRHRRKRLVALGAVLVEHDDFAGIDVADVFRADDVERAGFRRQNRTAVEFAQHQRADAERIAGADQLLVGHRHQRIGAFDGAQGFDEAVDEAVALGLRDQMQDDFGVGGGLHHGAVAHQFAAQGQPVGEIAVVADREAAGIEFGEQRLHVAQDGRAGGGVADVADGGVAGKALDHLAAGEGVADEAEPAFAVKSGAVEGDDAGGLLAAMLKCVQSECGDGGGLGVAEDAEHAAFLAQRVAFQIESSRSRSGKSRFRSPRSRSLCATSSEGLCISSIAPLFWPGINVLRASRSAFSGCRGQACCSHHRSPALPPGRCQFVHLLVYSS